MASKDDVIALNRAHPELTPAQIAERLGCRQEYVRATAQRYQLTLNSRSYKRTAQKIADTREAVKRVRRKRAGIVVANPDPVTVRPEALERAGSLDLPLIELTEDTCHYPFGDEPPFAFCGCKTAGASPYCWRHTIVCTGAGTASERNVAPVARKMLEAAE